MRILLKNGKIYDGSGENPYQGCLLIENGKIVETSPSIKISDGEEINLQGLSVAPGFIDAHSHNDWFAIKEEPLKYFVPFIRQGITSFIAGNCGLSAIGF